MRRSILAIALILLASPSFAQEAEEAQEETQETSCTTCHRNRDFFDDDQIAIVDQFAGDLHAAAGLSCHDCHGGNPDPELAEDLEVAKSGDFRGAPASRGDIPGFCGRCHSDPDYMRGYQPDLRVDQEQEYWTSRHGQALREGSTQVATCTDCHGVHGMLGPSNAESPVHPTRVAETCAGCHGDSERMSTLPGERSLPTHQYAQWSQSVHAAALFEKGDLTAPTCNDCHGNHGAKPPDVDSVGRICGQCHGREAELFRRSRKHDKFEAHNEFVESAAPESCSACHEETEPQAGLTSVSSFFECATCHGNHGVIRPTVAMLAPLPETPCAFCHEGSEPLVGEATDGKLAAKRQHYAEVLQGLLDIAAESDLEGEELFDYLVDAAPTLTYHTVVGGEGRVRRPEFARLFDKFRIGKTYYEYDNPDGAGKLRGNIVRCSFCHGADPQLGEVPVGYRTARNFLEGMQEVTSETAKAERAVLSAQRGGVEIRDALVHIDEAVDAQIGLEVLVHTFTTAPGSPFDERQKEGLASAQTAYADGVAALEVLDGRRRGLRIFLIVILLAAIGLGLKIRELS